MAKAKFTPSTTADGTSSLFVTKTELPALVAKEVARLIEAGEIDLEMSLGKDELAALTANVSLAFEARFKAVETRIDETREAMQRLYAAALKAGVKVEEPKAPQALTPEEIKAHEAAEEARSAEAPKAEAPKAEPKAEAPKAEEPKADKAEAPKPTAPKASPKPKAAKKK